MNQQPPPLNNRDQAGILSDLHSHIPGYAPEWSPGPSTNGLALMHVFARYMEILTNGLNQVPKRSLLAFLDMIGTYLLPAQAARAPLVFTLMDNSPVDVVLPANSQVASPAKPIAPSPLPTVQQSELKPIIFATNQTIILSRGRLSALYSIKPGSDEYADHTTRLTDGFTLFDNMSLTEHAIYLGHDHLFALAGDIKVLLSFTLTPGAERGLKLQWEYLTEKGWLPFVSLEEDDTTQGLQKDGQFVLRRECGPDAKKDTIHVRTSFWLRGRLTTPLLPEGTDGQRTIPVINDIRARLEFSKSDLLPEAAFADMVPLDTTKDFYPFGQQPEGHPTFYLASKEVFQRKGAQVSIKVELSQSGRRQGNVELEWEFYDGIGWKGLGVEAGPEDKTFTTDPTKVRTISFSCPPNWEETTVNGVKNYWLRVRVAEGDYGCPVRLDLAPTRIIVAISSNRKSLTVNTNQGYCGGESVFLSKGSATKEAATIAYTQGTDKLVLTSAIPGTVDFAGGTVEAAGGIPKLLAANLQPPIISKLTLTYSYLTDPEALDHCLSYNDFIFEDHSEASRWPDQTFKPFRPVADLQAAVHLGFDRPLPAGLISIYLDVPQAVTEDTVVSGASPFIWEYRTARGWTELGVLDETLGFHRSGMIQFIGPNDAIATEGLGGALYRIRARLKQGERPFPLPVSGIWLNAVWATQRTSIEKEFLGTSDGNPGQTLNFRYSPVLKGELIEVQEWTGNGEGWQTSVQGIPEENLRFDRDTATNKITGVWVRWQEQPHLYNSGANDRHYIIERATERATGMARFGNGRQGMIPPAGSRIMASYSSGGGIAGNVPAGAISEPRVVVPFIMDVTNPVPASGGADTEKTGSVLMRGPQRIRHLDRAVSPEDIEWLARDASPDVARARCLPITGPDGHAQRGWVTLVVIPHSPDARPQPTQEFRRRVRDYLARRVPATVAGKVLIVGPQYAPLDVKAKIVPTNPDEAAQVEARVRDNLNRFLHPLTGGRNDGGWDFGQGVYLSQIAEIIEDTPGVDYALQISLGMNGQIFDEYLPMDACTLIASGDHELKLIVGKG